jgi:hypothetical protein
MFSKRHSGYKKQETHIEREGVGGGDQKGDKAAEDRKYREGGKKRKLKWKEGDIYTFATEVSKQIPKLCLVSDKASIDCIGCIDA